jgi:hypothetical protein
MAVCMRRDVLSFVSLRYPGADLSSSDRCWIDGWHSLQMVLVQGEWKSILDDLFMTAWKYRYRSHGTRIQTCDKSEKMKLDMINLYVHCEFAGTAGQGCNARIYACFSLLIRRSLCDPAVCSIS